MATVKLGTISTALAASGSLSDQDLLDMYRQMVLVRTLDERIWMLNRQGKAAIVASRRVTRPDRSAACGPWSVAWTSSTSTIATWR